MARPALALLLTGAKADAWSVAPLMRASVHFCAATRTEARRQARAGVSSCARPVTHEDTPNFTWYDTFMDISLQQSSMNERNFYFPCLIKAALDRETAAIIDPALATLDQLKLWWDSFQPLPPEVRVQMKETKGIYFTYHSGALAGNTMSMRNTSFILDDYWDRTDPMPLEKKVLLVKGKTVGEHLEVLSHKEAFNYIDVLSLKILTAGPPTEVEIKAIHNILFRDSMPSEAGKYRTTKMQTASPWQHECADSADVPDAMADCVQWLERNEGTLHPVVLAAEAHFRLVSIRPFQDGNGRTARLLMNLLLLRAGYPVVVIHRDMRDAYNHALAAAHVDGELSQLQALVMRACEATLIPALALISNTIQSDSDRLARGQGRGEVFYQAMASASSDADVAARVRLAVARCASNRTVNYADPFTWWSSSD